jgi:rhodanese-related sulfurtransferase
LITRKPGYFPWPSIVQRQGRVIGINLAGGEAEFKGAVGNYATQVFDLPIACAGLSVQAARREGFDVLSAMVAQLERAHFWPEKHYMFLELVMEKGTGRVLGIQGIGDSGDGLVGRINTVAAILESAPTVTDIGNLEIAYSPEFSAAMDIVNTLGNAAENILLGVGQVMDPDEFENVWQNMDTNDWIVLDTRYDQEAEALVNKYPERWKGISLTELLARKDEVPKDKKIVVFCKTGERSYDSHVILNHMGIEESRNLQGGLLYLQRCGLVSEDNEVLE